MKKLLTILFFLISLASFGQVITPVNVGATPNSGTADKPRDAYIKINANEAAIKTTIDSVETALGNKAESSALQSHTGNTSNPHSVTKSQVGLGNVDNTSDANKPVSTATQNAIDAKVVDAITNGEATTAPSRNAVFDAFTNIQAVIDAQAERLDSLIKALEGLDIAPSIDGLPSISGIAVVGNTLTVTPSSVTGAGVTNTYQWERNGSAISGATNTTYLLVSADYEATITVVQTATNTTGSDIAESVGVVVAPADVPENIENISLSYSIVQRTGTAITIDATAFETVTSWKWELIDAEDGTIIETETTADPTFSTAGLRGLYDVSRTASNSGDVDIAYIKDAFIVFPAKPAEEDCDILLDFDSSPTFSYFQDFGGADNAGMIICIKGSHNAGSASSGGYLGLFGLRSADPDNPVRIVKLGSSQTLIKNISGSGSPHALYMDSGPQNVEFDGFLPNGTNGVKFQTTNYGSQLAMIRGAYTRVTLAGIDFDQDITNTEAAGSNVTFSPLATAGFNATNFVAKRIVLFGLNLARSNQEGFYIGYNNDNLISGFSPFKIDSLVIARCTIFNARRDACQIGGTTNFRVHSNIIMDWGLWHHSSHENAFSYNGGNSNGLIRGNICIGGEMFVNIQSGNYPFHVFNGEAIPGKNKIIGNYFNHGTYTVGAGTPEPFSIYIQNQQNSGTTAGLQYDFLENTIISDKSIGEAYSHSNSWPYTVNVKNNIIIAPGSTEFSTQGPGTHPTINENNLTRVTGSEADLLFTDLINHDFTISSLSSPVFSEGSPTDLIAEYPELKYTLFGLYGAPLLAPGERFTWGAYSGFNTRENDPASAGTLTFTTDLAASSITANGFTVDWQPDFNGWGYVTILLGDASTPSTQQIIDGTDANDNPAPASFIMTNGPDGVMSSEAVVGLLAGTEYDIYAVFIDVYGRTHTVTKVDDVETDSDAGAPTLSNFTISSLHRNRLRFTTSEQMTGTTFTGFTFSSGKTPVSVTFVDATKGYFTMNSAYITGGTEDITYTTGSDFADINGNALAAISETEVTNNITSNAEQDVTSFQNQNGSLTGNDFTATGVNPGGMRTVQGIPAGSDGYIEFQLDDPTTLGIQCGLQNGAVTYTYSWPQILLNMRFEDPSENISTYAGQTFRAFVSNNQYLESKYWRIRVDGATGDLFSEHSNDGSSWVTTWTETGDGLGLNLYGAVHTNSTTSGRTILNIRMQCDDGLIVDTE